MKTVKDAAHGLLSEIEKIKSPKIPLRDLADAMYVLSESGHFFGGESIDSDTAIEMWKLIEYLKLYRIPDEYRL